MSRSFPQQAPKHGFTLVEMLVSMAILVLLIVLIAQMTSSATTVTTNSRKHMDTDSQARLVFDRMANDFSNMVRRKDVDYLFYKTASSTTGVNDAMFFYSEAPAYLSLTATNSSSVAVIGYRVNPTSLQLERLGEKLSWDGQTTNDATSTSTNAKPGGMTFLTFPGATPDPGSTLAGTWQKTIGTAGSNYTDGTDSSFHAIGDQVYRLEVSFLLTDGSISTKPILTPAAASPSNNLSAAVPPVATNDSAGGYGAGSRWYDTSGRQGYICTSAAAGAAVWSPIGIQDVSGFIVGLGILDTNSRALAGSTTGMVGALPDAVDGAPIATTWRASNYLKVSGTGSSGVSQAAASQLRIYERYFYLNTK